VQDAEDAAKRTVTSDGYGSVSPKDDRIGPRDAHLVAHVENVLRNP
jgi:hypothetical protein